MTTISSTDSLTAGPPTYTRIEAPIPMYFDSITYRPESGTHLIAGPSGCIVRHHGEGWGVQFVITDDLDILMRPCAGEPA